MPSRADRPRAAIIRPSLAQMRIATDRIAPHADLAEWVDYFWWVRWDLAEPHVQEVVPRPAIHVSAEPVDGIPRLVVTGVQPRMFSRRLQGRGLTVAATFRPAMFRCLLGSDVSDLQGREVCVGDLLHEDDRGVAAAVLGAEDPGAGAQLLGEWIRGRRPVHDPVAQRVSALVERAEEDTSIVSAEQLAGIAGVGLRTLQRWFRAYVGISPRWVVRRSRLLDVTAAAHSAALGEGAVDWAALAAHLGYADQSHLIRAFTQLVGQPPASYVRDA